MDKPYLRIWTEGKMWYWEMEEGYERATGFKDKNGKDIYEGDILRHYDDIFEENKTIGVVRFGLAGMDSGYYTYNGFYIAPIGDKYANRDSQEAYSKVWENLKEVEVIGNIHGNPELLEVNNAVS